MVGLETKLGAARRSAGLAISCHPNWGNFGGVVIWRTLKPRGTNNLPLSQEVNTEVDGVRARIIGRKLRW